MKRKPESMLVDVSHKERTDALPDDKRCTVRKGLLSATYKMEGARKRPRAWWHFLGLIMDIAKRDQTETNHVVLNRIQICESDVHTDAIELTCEYLIGTITPPGDTK